MRLHQKLGCSAKLPLSNVWTSVDFTRSQMKTVIIVIFSVQFQKIQGVIYTELKSFDKWKSIHIVFLVFIAVRDKCITCRWKYTVYKWKHSNPIRVIFSYFPDMIFISMLSPLLSHFVLHNKVKSKSALLSMLQYVQDIQDWNYITLRHYVWQWTFTLNKP